MGFMLHRFQLVSTDLDNSKVEFFIFKTRSNQHTGQPKNIRDEELNSLLGEDYYQILNKLAEALNVIKIAVYKRSKSMGMVQKERNWVPFQLKPRNI